MSPDSSLDEFATLNNSLECQFEDNLNGGCQQETCSRAPMQTDKSTEEELEEEDFATIPGAETRLDHDVDGGYAWIILAVMFIINATTFGTARAYCLIYDKLVREGQLNHTQAARPFNLMGAIENMAGPLSGYILASNEQSWRLTVSLGSCLITLAHLLAALTPNDSLEGHLVSMGLMCGLGLSFVMISSFQINNAYFVRYRSRAFGLGLSSAAFGSLAISKLSERVLDEYEGTSACYMLLSLLLAPNVLLSPLLKPKGALVLVERVDGGRGRGERGRDDADEDETEAGIKLGFMAGLKLVLKVPIFHLIWPTQLLFCWFNFVLGMIIVDFCQDRGLGRDDARNFVLVWAFGQLAGRLFLSTLVDLRLLSYRSFTVISLAAISLSVFILNELRFETDSEMETELRPLPALHVTPLQKLLIMMALVFVLSALIALLYIIFNGLVVTYMDLRLQPLSIGISSFLGSFLLLPRASAIGFFRDTTGNYDSLLSMLSLVALVAALTWLIVPSASKYLNKLCAIKCAVPPVTGDEIADEGAK